MIWIIINILFAAIGIILIIASDYFNRFKDDDILELLMCCGGCVSLACLVISEPLRWWLG